MFNEILETSKEQDSLEILLCRVMGPGRPQARLSEEAKQYLSEQANRLKASLEAGEAYCKTEKQKFGGSSLPGEPGWQRYFKPL